eukprot:scaffold6874_cov19-Tisochrysis_lutea.AAC.1
MDETAITLCKENNIPVIVFNIMHQSRKGSPLYQDAFASGCQHILWTCTHIFPGMQLPGRQAEHGHLFWKTFLCDPAERIMTETLCIPYPERMAQTLAEPLLLPSCIKPAAPSMPPVVLRQTRAASAKQRSSDELLFRPAAGEGQHPQGLPGLACGHRG